MTGLFRQGRGTPWSLLALMLLGGATAWWGCQHRNAAPGADANPVANGGIPFETLLESAGFSLWQRFSELQAGEGLEGLAGLVDGAAEGLWQQGVYKAALQEFTVGEKAVPLEFQRYVFRGDAQAARYLQAACGEAKVPLAWENACGGVCLIPGEYASRGFVRVGAEVTEVRAYAAEAPAGPFVEQLTKTLGRMGCR